MTTCKRILVIHDREHFNKALQFGDWVRTHSEKPRSGPMDCINRLLLGGIEEEEEMHLYPDFVPHSFYFELKKGKDRLMNGGIICHGQKDVDTFSVEVCPQDGVYWSVHT